MPSANNAKIMKFRPNDREAVRKITYDTAFLGKPASAFFDGEKLVCDALTLYYTDYEPQSCFVAEINGEVVGCLIGAKNKIASERVIFGKIVPALVWDALVSGALFQAKNLTFLFRVLSSMGRGEFKMPDFIEKYPAVLHINIKEGCRGLHIGKQLIAAYLDYLRQEKIPGVYLATMTKGAGEFFSKQGFELLHSGRRSYFTYLLGSDVPIYIYGKVL